MAITRRSKRKWYNSFISNTFILMRQSWKKMKGPLKTNKRFFRLLKRQLYLCSRNS